MKLTERQKNKIQLYKTIIEKRKKFIKVKCIVDFQSGTLIFFTKKEHFKFYSLYPFVDEEF
jgi:hypothetical protein